MNEFSNYDKLINSEEFKNASGDFPVPIGELINGEILIQDMKKIPHMLVTGVTGCGKTTFVQSLMLALCSGKSQDQIRFCIYDSKGIDYLDFNKLPFLYKPVVKDGSYDSGIKINKVRVLQRVVLEILKRQEKTQECINLNKRPEFPDIFIVLDDYATIMNDVEGVEAISRILLNGRSVGIHLILVTSTAISTIVTQPVLAATNLKVSFNQPNKPMSKMAVGIQGAEILNIGEILVAYYATINKCRALCMDVDEIKQKIDVIASKNSFVCELPTELKEMVENCAIATTDDYDEILPQAVDVVFEMGWCSVSILQRRLKLGYSRAARVVDQMEKLGIVGPYEGANPRRLLVNRNDWNKIQHKYGIVSKN